MIMQRANPEYIFVGDLHLRPGLKDYSTQPLTGLCISKNSKLGRTSQAPLFDVTYHLAAIVPFTSVKVHMFSGQRLDISTVSNESQDLAKFLNQTLSKKFTHSGRSVNAILMEMKKDEKSVPFIADKNKNYPLSKTTHFILFGEISQNEKTSKVYAYQLYSTSELTRKVYIARDCLLSQTKKDTEEGVLFCTRQLQAITSQADSDRLERTKEQHESEKQRAYSSKPNIRKEKLKDTEDMDDFDTLADREDMNNIAPENYREKKVTRISSESKALAKTPATKKNIYEAGNKHVCWSYTQRSCVVLISFY
ncbi:hypothetical protein BDF14DRAFT_1488601 [Spinellus fusiger]|nr:hypothetical protein BDF14DRAFT_1488601 [Spinellus fusiger]